MKRDKIALLSEVLGISPVILASSDDILEVYLPSMSKNKAEDYVSSLYLSTDERKTLTMEMLSKFETLSIQGMKKTIERINELIILAVEGSGYGPCKDCIN